MTDVAEVENGTETETPAEKPAKAPKVGHPCACSTFEVHNPDDAEEVFATGCTQTTFGTFAQGHDARLVSFLVDGQADGFKIRQNANGTTVEHDSPSAAVADFSQALQKKAEKATENRQVRDRAKVEKREEREAKRAAAAEAKAAKRAERDAAKAAKEAAGPRAVGAGVQAGSQEGDQPVRPDGTTRIKVGRWEYDALVDTDGKAHYTDGKGDSQTALPGEFNTVD